MLFNHIIVIMILSVVLSTIVQHDCFVINFIKKRLPELVLDPGFQLILPSLFKVIDVLEPDR